MIFGESRSSPESTLAEMSGKAAGSTVPLMTIPTVPDWSATKRRPDNFLDKVWGVLLRVSADRFDSIPDREELFKAVLDRGGAI
jgi:hypothetical protein